MKIVLVAALLSLLAATPSMAKDETTGDQAPANALTPGVQEPRTPDTLKPNADQRIENRAVRSQETTEGKGDREPAKPDIK
jgi:hypothetical protein